MAHLISLSEVSDEVAPAEPSNECDILEQLTKSGMQSLMELIKASNNLPIDQWDFFKTFPSFNGLIMPESQRILEILNKILKDQNIHGSVTRRDDEEKYEMVIEANDAILERVDSNLDELQGLKKNPEPVVGEIRAIRRRGMFSLSNRESNRQTGVIHSLVTTRLNSRPQIKFKDKVDNRSIPFEPRIKEKPNALKPLAILLEKYDDRGESFSHPYEYELSLFKPSENHLKTCEPLKPKPLAEVPLLFVNNLDTLKEMMEHLRTCKEIAVDLEHHSYRSFQGFTCLVQISTRERDYIVDALELRHELHILNEVFTDPQVVKVFHGAEHDIEWLQRDLSVYVVNMFDTHQAAQLLDFPRLSLAHLLKVFCNVDTNKQFQLFDWRTRPIPEEAIKYAREDTHYLLYIYDELKNSLIEKCQNKSNLLEVVLSRSTEICKRKYWKDILTENSHMEFYRRSKKMFDNRQMYALKHLYQWRDKVARDEDESIMYVLPNHMLLSIAEGLPREVQGISALCNPVPPLVRLYEREIHKIILKARDQSLVKPIVEGDSFNQSFEIQPNWVPVNVDSKLYCPHDFSHSDDDFRENLPTLLERNFKPLTSIDLKKNKFCVSGSAAVDVLCTACENESEERNASVLKGKFVSPYQRYQKVMAFVHADDASKLKSQNGATHVGGPSTSEDQVVDVIDSNENTEMSTASVVHPHSAVNPVSSAQATPVIGNENDQVNSVRKKKKKKRNDVENSETSASSNKEVVEESESLPADASKDCDNRTAIVKANESVIPSLMEQEQEVTGTTEEDQSSSVSNKQKSKAAVSSRSAEKKKLDTDGVNDGPLNKKRMKNKDDFQPFNYNEVDFSRFQSTANKKNSKKTPDSNKKSQGRRTPWLGNKKSIMKTLGNLNK